MNESKFFVSSHKTSIFILTSQKQNFILYITKCCHPNIKYILMNYKIKPNSEELEII